MRRRTFLAAAALPFWNAALEPTAARPKRTSRVVDRLRRVSQERREALDQNGDHRAPAELNRDIPEIDDLEVVNGASSARPRKTLRLIAWNTERGRHWRDGARLIQETPGLRDPDILLLGEMDLGMARSSNEHTTREMAAALRMNYVYGVEFLELTGGELQEREQYPGTNEWGYHGNAILSRYPLRNVRMLRFPGIEKWYDGKAYGASEAEQLQKRLGGRMAIFATVSLGRDVAIVSTHLESSPRDSPARKRQMEMVLEELKAYAKDAPVILGGDLNGVPSEPMFEGVRAAGFRLEDSNDSSGGTIQRVVDGKVVVGDKYIDYLLIRGLRVVRDETSPKVIPGVYPPGENGRLLADHAIVTAKVELPWLG
jgi:endonuclease/exonuclease/phosphatase family metal-dependent hydrolase